MKTCVLREWELPLSVDLVLAGQGADPAVLRRRRPQLVTLAERAVEESAALLQPQLAYRRVEMIAVDHDRLRLAEAPALTAPHLVQQLGKAQYLVALIVTLGPRLEARMTEVMASDPAYALALDGLGTVAVDALYRAAYRRFETEAVAQGLCLSRPFSPGTAGWPLDEGQRWLFSLLDAATVGVTVFPGGQMRPRKSCSALVGAGEDITPYHGRPCPTCALQATCAYRRRHALAL